jgi:hypothetical protein
MSPTNLEYKGVLGKRMEPAPAPESQMREGGAALVFYFVVALH